MKAACDATGRRSTGVGGDCCDVEGAGVPGETDDSDGARDAGADDDGVDGGGELLIAKTCRTFSTMSLLDGDIILMSRCEK